MTGAHERGRVVVVGGGLSGLACACALVGAGREVVLLEGAERAGGVVRTGSEAGFVFEEGPSTVLASARELRTLVRELGIEGELIESDPAAKDRFLYYGGRLVALPTGPLSAVATPLLSLRAKLRFAAEPFLRHRRRAEDEPEPTVARFVAERIGPEAARTLIGAFVRGVYAAELDELGAASAFPRMWAMAQEHGGLVRGALKRAKPAPVEGRGFRRGALLSFERGLGRLVEALVERLGERVRLGARVEALERGAEGARWRVRLAKGASLDARDVVLAVPARAAAALLTPHAPPGFPLDFVRSIPHGRVAVVQLGLAGEAARALPAGFGYLVPPGGRARTGREGPRALGTVFASRLFPSRAPPGHALASSFYRLEDLERELGARASEDEAVLALAREDLARALRLGAPPELALGRVRRWEGVIPRYAPGHARAVEALLAALPRALPGIALAGAWLEGVSVELVIARGRRVARELAETARG